MLLINGVTALIGLVMALIVYSIRMSLDITGAPLILVGAVALFVYLFLSDLAEDKLIEAFDK